MSQHWAIVKSSGRMLRVQRCGRLLIIPRGRFQDFYEYIATPRYDGRFHLLPQSYERSFAEYAIGRD